MPVFRSNKSMKDYGERLVLDGKTVRGINGAGLYTRAPQIFDHFEYGAGAFNSHVPQKWVTTETGAATPFAPSATLTSAVGVTGGVTNNAEEFAGKTVAWKPSTGATRKPLVFECRAKFVGTTTATDGDFVIGLADAVTYTSGLAYVVGASSLYTTSAPVEFAGFHYSSVPTSGTLYQASGNYIGRQTQKASTAGLAASTGVVKDSSFHIYRVEVDVNGTAAYFIDDKFVGRDTTGVTATVALVPYIGVIAKASHAHTATVDYMYVRGDLIP